MTGLDHYPAGLNAFQMVPPIAPPAIDKVPVKRSHQTKVLPVREAMKRLAMRVNQYSDAARFINNDKSDAIRRGGI